MKKSLGGSLSERSLPQPKHFFNLIHACIEYVSLYRVRECCGGHGIFQGLLGIFSFQQDEGKGSIKRVSLFVSSNSSPSMFRPASCVIAGRWRRALVDPPVAACTMTAFMKSFSPSISLGLRSRSMSLSGTLPKQGEARWY